MKKIIILIFCFTILYLKQPIFCFESSSDANQSLKLLSNEKVTYTLDDIFKIALKNNIEFKNTKLNKLSLERAKDNLTFFYLPRVNLKYFLPLNNIDFNSSSAYSTSNFILSFDQNLPFDLNLNYEVTSVAHIGGNSNYYDSYNNKLEASLSYEMHPYKIFNKDLKYSNRKYLLQKLTYKNSLISFQYFIIESFYSLFKQQEAFKIVAKSYELSLSNYNNGLRKFKAGLIAESEMLDLELYLQKKNISQKRSQNAFIKQKNEFKNIVGLNLGKDIELKFTKEIYFVKTSYEEDLEQVLLNNLSLFDLSDKIENDKEVISDLYKSNLKGSIRVGYNLESIANNGNDFSYIPISDYSAGLSLEYNVFDHKNISNSLDYNKLNLKIDKDKWKKIKNEIGINLKDKINELNLNFQYLKISKKSNELSKKLYAISKNRFENGFITSKDLILNQIEYINSKQELVNSKIDYIISVYDYKAYKGELLYGK